MNRFVRFLRGLSSPRNTPAIPRARLMLEALEDRLVPSTLSGFVYNDANNNGTVDSGEASLAGVTVTLTDSSNHKVTATTDTSGAYSFANLADGTYSLSESAPSGYLNGLTTKGSLGGSPGSGLISGITVDGSSDGTGYNFGELAKADGWSAIQSNFNATAIKEGSTLWFSSVFKISGLSSSGGTLNVTGQSITFTANGNNYDIPVPDSVITFDPTAPKATTTFDAASQTWQTTLPLQFSGNGFLSAVAFKVPTGGLPGGINPVTWQGQFTSNTAGVTVNWQWATAVYTSFSTDLTTLNVKPVDDSHLSIYQNSDHAGTPEADKSYVTGGARGGGGSNYTGSYSATTSVAPPVVSPVSSPATQPASLSGYVTNVATGLGVGGVTIYLLDSTGTVLIATTTTDSTGFYQFTNVAAGTYTLQEDVYHLPPGLGQSSATPGTVGGNTDGNEVDAADLNQIVLASGQNGINYDFFLKPFMG